MGFFDQFFKKNNAIKNTRNTHINIPVLGRQSEVLEEDIIDDELPSVNRRKGRSKFIDMLGFATLLGAGLVMIYFINTGNDKKIEEAPKQLEIANRLPPLEMPEPPAPLPPPEANIPPIGLQQLQAGKQPSPNVPSGPPKPTWLDRRMGGSMVLGGENVVGSPNSKPGENNSPKLANVAASADAPSPLALKLKSTVSPGVSANLLPDRDYLITKGTALDCALETALDSTVPGITTCRLTRDVYSDNGHVVLLDRGSQLVGEYQGGITAGQARIFVLWTRAKTPNGVIVNLDSPGTDALGRAGHAGWVDTHFMERFGAAIILSLIKDGFKIAQSNNDSQISVGGGGSDQLATEILKNTVNIPPTLYINQGEHIQVMVARDLDFSTVYGLELKE
ncbi:MAG: type IV secretion system protein VirB10 [Methylotenera sp.]